MIHLGMGAFDAVVQTTSCVIRNSPIDTNGTYFRLVDSKDKKSDFLKNIGGGYKIDMLIFNKVVNNIFFYWLSKPMLNVFINSKSLSFFADAKQGTATAKNNLFLRMWFEISFYRIGFNCTDKINAFATGKKWFPYNKGGAYRKWYGNNDYVINWENNGEAVLNYKDNTGKQLSVVRNTKYYFQECISWSDVSSSRPSFRFKTTGFIFDASGPSIFMKDDFTKNEKYLLGVLNTSLVAQILKVLAPSLHFSVGHVSAIPIFNPTVNTTISEETSDLAKENIEQSKKDWDSFETSWDFKKHPLI